jgi:hypothetical protein
MGWDEEGNVLNSYEDAWIWDWKQLQETDIARSSG